ncbi:hypothetical protein SDC9_30252 [bioreactor metagenome]|uniref:Bypass of forespore C C-terminal domain-containing protein n=1 Tax=bioreactor metagenome TaxID=1076179 RepID=A0A644UZ84_9ZZZZ|nr:BofC C-terminal domain-containing protein [Negativicutes bacterium]
MLPLLKWKKKQFLTIAGIALVIGCATYYLVNYNQGENTPLIPHETEVTKQDSKIKINANTDLVQKIIYLKCNDEEVVRSKPADNLIGLNYHQVQKVYQGWTMDKFDNQEVAMTLKVDSFCREHANNMFIGVKDGYVTVFYGKPGSKALVKEITKIPVNKMHPQDIEELKRGMVVQSREELLRTLEGMDSR